MAVYEQMTQTHGTDLRVSDVLGACVGPRRWEGKLVGRMKVSVTREVPSGRHFIRDDDNLRFCVKPLLDALTRQGYIRNDSRTWIELSMPAQKISADKQHWTTITIEPLPSRTPRPWREPLGTTRKVPR